MRKYFFPFLYIILGVLISIYLFFPYNLFYKNKIDKFSQLLDLKLDYSIEKANLNTFILKNISLSLPSNKNKNILNLDKIKVKVSPFAYFLHKNFLFIEIIKANDRTVFKISHHNNTWNIDGYISSKLLQNFIEPKYRSFWEQMKIKEIPFKLICEIEGKKIKILQFSTEKPLLIKADGYISSSYMNIKGIWQWHKFKQKFKIKQKL